MIFNFYSEFFPGLRIYENGYVKVTDMKLFCTTTGTTKGKICQSNTCTTCMSGMQRLNTAGDAQGFIDFYGKINFIFFEISIFLLFIDARLIMRKIALCKTCTDSGILMFNVYDAVDVDDWCNFVKLPKMFYQGCIYT